MTYTSLTYFIFLLGLVLVYFLTPKKIQWIVLLAGSYLFYVLAAGAGAVVFPLVTTVSVFLIARQIGAENEKWKGVLASVADSEEKKSAKRHFTARKKRILLVGLLLNFGILAALKYSGFVVLNMNSLLNTEIGAPGFLLPLGISFYTFQTTGYLIDIYRGKYEPDKNILKFALFTSFFPQIVQGPISRHDQLAHQLYAGHSFDWVRARHGAELMLWGLFKKLVIADRAIVFVNFSLENSGAYAGFQTAMICLVYMAYIYADFSGGIDISRGICQILGIELTENFRRPYFSNSLTDFWRRWHITLGAWMRDYIFYTLTLSKSFGRLGKRFREKRGKYWGIAVPAGLATGITFFVVGVWHGAAWQYVVFGLVNAVVIMFETIFYGRIAEWNNKRGFVNTKAFSWRLLTILATFFIVFLSKFFPMAYGAAHALRMIKSTFTAFNPEIFVDGSLYAMGLSEGSFKLLMFAVVIFFIVSLMQENGIRLREALDRQNIVFRWLVYFVALFSILIFGAYGPDVDANAFIYQQF